MAGSRAQIVAAFRDALDPARWDVKQHPLPISQPEPKIEGVIVVERQVITPAPNQGSYLEEHHVWVITPTQELAAVEDDLDARLEEALDVIQDLGWMSFEAANRAVFREQYHAFDVTIQVVTNKEPE